MRAHLKVLLALELFVSFTPALVLLFLGLMFSPMIFMGFIMDPRLDTLNGPVMIVGGLCGVIGISVVVYALIAGTKPRLSTSIVLVLTAMGFVGLLPVIIGSHDSHWWRLFAWLPILASLHVIYLARSQLFIDREQVGDPRL